MAVGAWHKRKPDMYWDSGYTAIVLANLDPLLRRRSTSTCARGSLGLGCCDGQIAITTFAFSTAPPTHSVV
jgi:hypothetical protein